MSVSIFCTEVEGGRNHPSSIIAVAKGILNAPKTFHRGEVFSGSTLNGKGDQLSVQRCQNQEYEQQRESEDQQGHYLALLLALLKSICLSNPETPFRAVCVWLEWVLERLQLGTRWPARRQRCRPDLQRSGIRRDRSEFRAGSRGLTLLVESGTLSLVVGAHRSFAPTFSALARSSVPASIYARRRRSEAIEIVDEISAHRHCHLNRSGKYRSGPRFCFSTLSRSTCTNSCGTFGKKVVLRLAISGRFRAASRKMPRFLARSAISPPERSSSMKVNLARRAHFHLESPAGKNRTQRRWAVC